MTYSEREKRNVSCQMADTVTIVARRLKRLQLFAKDAFYLGNHTMP